jgi:hypothetical protein
MQQLPKLLFTEETLAQIPIFFRYLTESETKEVSELRTTSRFSVCDRYFSSNHLRIPSYKPTADENLSLLFKELAQNL